MFHPDMHKPILALALTSLGTATLHTVAPEVPVHVIAASPDYFSILEPWVHLIGGIVGIAAGIASISWYLYSFVKARQATGDD